MSYARKRVRVGPVLAIVLISARPLAAQVDSSLAVVPCNGQRVSAIEVRPGRPDFGGSARHWRALAHKLGLHHSTTRINVVRRFITMAEGDHCDEFRRLESERILRAQPYLASASVRAVDDSAGGVRLVVETEDEVPVIFGGGWHGLARSAIQVGNMNMFGEALLAEVGFEHRANYRSGFQGRFVDWQALGRPYMLAISGQRAPVGEALSFELTHPFLSDLQHRAWHTGAAREHSYAGALRPEGASPAFPFRRTTWDAGIVQRIGGGAAVWLLGAVAAGDRADPRGTPVLVGDTGLSPHPDSAFLPKYQPYHATRGIGIVGLRILHFRTMVGLDALSARQDVARGVQIGALVGRSVPTGDADNDMLLGGDAYIAGGGGQSFLAVRAIGEMRRDLRTNTWDAIVASGRAGWYAKPRPRHTMLLSLEGAGAWRARLPVQLALGAWDGGVRGFRGSREVGGQRLVLRAEERWHIGRIRTRADIGAAAFSDVGAVWAGDVPYGTSSGARASVGAGLLTAFPAGSRRTWRLDLAVPVTGGAVHGLELRFSVSAAPRGFWREPHALARGRSFSTGSGIFSWP